MSVDTQQYFTMAVLRLDAQPFSSLPSGLSGFLEFVDRHCDLVPPVTTGIPGEHVQHVNVLAFILL